MKIQELTEWENCIVDEMKKFPLVAWLVCCVAQLPCDVEATRKQFEFFHNRRQLFALDLKEFVKGFCI